MYWIFSTEGQFQPIFHDTLIKQKNDIQTTLRELPLDRLEKLGEMIAELNNGEKEGEE